MAEGQPLQNQVLERIQNFKPADVGASITKAGESVTNFATSAQEKVTGQLNEFSSSVNMSSAGQDFLNSNSIIAKFVFVILVLIVFMFLLNLGITLIGYFTQSSHTPYLVYGLIDGASGLVIPQDPAQDSGVNILRSNNQATGLEYTWSVWLLVTNAGFTGGKPYNVIFNKGGSVYDASGLARSGNSPGLYLTKDSITSDTNLYILLDTGSPNSSSGTKTQSINVQGIPINKWFHVAMRMQNKVMDVYVNGTISSRTVLPTVPIQNYYNTNVGTNSGFSGSLSNLQYFDYALSSFSISNIVLAGPNLNISSRSPSLNTTTNANYMSSLWYTSKLASPYM